MMIPKMMMTKKKADPGLIQKLTDMVSDKNNVTGAIVDMFMDDAPATQLASGYCGSCHKKWC